MRRRDTRVGSGRRHVFEVVQHVEHGGVGPGGQQRHAELLVLVSSGDVLVAAGVDTDGDAQHHTGAFAELAGDGGDALRLVGLVDHDFGEALFDGQRDFLIGLGVAVSSTAARAIFISPIVQVSTNMPASVTNRTISLDRNALPAKLTCVVDVLNASAAARTKCLARATTSSVSMR